MMNCTIMLLLNNGGDKEMKATKKIISIEDLKEQRKTAIYVRESSKFQANEGYNIHLQEEKCKGCIEAMFDEDINNTIVYREKGFSAKTIKRPVLDQLLRDIRHGKIKRVVVQKLDRLARRGVGMWDLLEIFNEYDVQLVALRENIISNEAVFKIALTLHIALAETEQDTISERTNEALLYAAKQGSYIKGGRAPFGTAREKVYRDDGSHIITLNPHPLYWEVLKKIYDLSYNGANCTEISCIVNSLSVMKENKKSLNEDTIEKILSNKIYCGIQKLKGEEYPVDFTGCLDYDYWKQVQINRSVHLNRDTKHAYKYHGKVHCECGTLCVVDISKKRLADGTIKYYRYYVCPNCGKRISEAVVYENVEPELKTYFEKNVSEKNRHKQQLRINKIESRNEMLYRLFMADKLPLNDYMKELEKSQAHKERIEKNIHRGIKRYDKLSEDERKEFINECIKSIKISSRNKIEITYNA